jgi:hypothetical protein
MYILLGHKFKIHVNGYQVQNWIKYDLSLTNLFFIPGVMMQHLPMVLQLQVAVVKGLKGKVGIM